MSARRRGRLLAALGVVLIGTTVSLAQMRIDGLPAVVRAVTGALLGDGSETAPSLAFLGDPDTGVYRLGAGAIIGTINGVAYWRTNGSDLWADASSAYAWSGSSVLTTVPDLYLTRDTAGTLAIRNGTNAQTQRWYETFTDASNYERGEVVMGSNLLTLRTGTAGTGSDDLGVAITPSGAGFVTVTSIATAGGTPTVANVGANSCGTSAATIAGNDNAGIITVGATSGTQCRITFTKAAPTRWFCTFNNETTANLARSTYVDTTHVDAFGTFVGGDVVSYLCAAR